MNDRQLMASIFSAWQRTIAGAVTDNLAPDLRVYGAPILAALVANESGGNPNAKRFEPTVFAELCEVLAGHRTTYKPTGASRPLMASDLLPFVSPAISEPAVIQWNALSTIFTQSLARVTELATSYGLVQIMGWHWIEFNRPASIRPEDQLAFAVVLLVYFANKYTLDFAADAAKLFSCWNTGEPGGHTYDPQYVPNALARMELYRSIAGGAGPSAT